MQRHLFGLTLVTLKPICDILFNLPDPISTPVIYQQIGQDLTGAPIEAGFGEATWTWDTMSQADYNALLALQGDAPGVACYLRTSRRSGTSGIDFANYSAVVERPTFETREGLICHNVTLHFIRLVAV